MEPKGSKQTSRKVVIGTVHGTIEGDLQISPTLRTLDFLNRNATSFVSIHKARSAGSRWHFGSDQVILNASTITWVAEVEAQAAGSARPLNRSAVRLRFEEFEVTGFIHIPLEGNLLERLKGENKTFIALTSASMIGPQAELATAFLAVNRLHAFTAEIIGEDDSSSEMELMAEEVGQP